MKVLRSFLVLGTALGLTLAGFAVFAGSQVQAVSAQLNDPEDSLWGDDPSPCEAAFGFDRELRVTIPLHQRERELIHLAMEGFVADMDHEATGTAAAVPPFQLRTGFLGFFINVVVPSVQDRVAGAFENEWPTPENEEAMLRSVQNVEFGGCERTAVSIAIEKWTTKSGGQMAAHLKLCDASMEMRQSSACLSFDPLAAAYDSLTKKIEKDQ